jgi:Mg-chelatase subunit ChlD
MARLTRHRPAAAQRYLALELGRVGAQLDQLLPSRTVRRIKSTAPQDVSPSSEASLTRALSRELIPSPPAWVGELRPSRFRRASESDLYASPTAEDLTRRHNLDEQPPQQDDEPVDDTDESKILKLLSAPGMVNPLGEAIQKLLGMGRSAPEKNQGGSEIPVSRQRLGPLGRNARRVGFSSLLSSVLEPAQLTGIRYPEWDCNKGRYRPDWCTVGEYDPAVGDGAPASAAGAGNLHRALARVGIELEHHRRQCDGDTLDLSALVDYQADLFRGDDPDPNIYENSRMTRRDLSVMILLDCSGSTAEKSSAQTVFEEERQLAAELTADLERLGDRVGTYGFYSRGKDAVTFLRIKEFDDRFDAAAKRRLASVQPHGFTRLGAAMRHGGHVLCTRALAKNMILVMIGDGLPYDDGYEDRYARADVRQAITETMQRGIGVVGIGIRSSTDPAVLQDSWSEAPFRVIADSRDIQRHLRGLLLNALAITRANGRRRESLTEEQHRQLRSMYASRCGKLNTYV